MKILMITQWFDPEPTFKGMPFAREISENGHEVQVLTGFPNYPGGKLYPGYRIRPYQRESLENVVIHRVPLFPSHNHNSLHRIANYVSYSVSAAFLGPIKAFKPDVIYAYHPPPTVAIPSYVIKRFTGAPIVYDIQDMWPETLSSTGMLNSPYALKCVEKYCQLVYKTADQIVVLSPGFKRNLIDKGVPESKISVIYNWTYEDAVGAITRDAEHDIQYGLTDRFNVVFAGNMGMAQGLDALLDASKRIVHEPKIQIVLIGGGIDRERLERRVADEKMNNVRFLPSRPPSQMGPLLAATDIAVVHLVDDPLFKITIPSKTQGYLHAGRVILMAVNGDAADLVTQSRSGEVVTPQDPDDIARGILKIYAMPKRSREKMCENAAQYYADHLSLKTGAGKFISLFEEALNAK